MVRSRSLRVALLPVLLLVSLSAGFFAANPSIASAATPNRAAVIVDTGGAVHRVVITFTEDSITGIDALQRAGANPVVYAMGPGGAVCRIFGVGRDAGPNCLGGQDGDARYWAYFRGPAGTSTFKYSSVGAGSARVHDGDVEGWKFGTGAAPTYVSLASLLPPPPPPPSTTPTTKAATPGGGSTGSGGPGTTPGSTPGATSRNPATGGAPSASTLPLTGDEATAANAESKADAKEAKDTRSSSRSDPSGGRETGADGQTVKTALASSDGGGGGSSGLSLVWFAALIAAIVAAVVVIRRARRRST